MTKARTKLKIFSIAHEGAASQSLGAIDFKDGENYAATRIRLEEVGFPGWPFHFWDVGDGCRIVVQLERLNSTPDNVYVIPVESEDCQASKRRRVGDEPVVLNCIDDSSVHKGVLEFSSTDDVVYTLDPTSSSGVSDSCDVEVVEEILLMSALIGKEVLEMYQRGEQKLRKELKDISLEDHMWTLKTWDKDGAPIVKLHCIECDLDFGGGSSDHNKNTVSNLFSNFMKSHIKSNRHIRNWCKRKGLDWSNHPQSQVQGKGKCVILTSVDHKRLVDEGIATVNVVNDDSPAEWPPFVLVGDYESSAVRCFWVKTMCSYCRDCFHLCPPKKNLEANLRNHLGGARHAEAVEKDSTTKGARTALMTGKRGRPSKSSGNSFASNQKSIHHWFRHTPDGEEEGEFCSWDRSCFLGLVCWGFRGPYALYSGKRYEVSSLLSDAHPGQNWYSEPHIRSSFISEGVLVEVKGTFRSVQCLRFPSATDPWMNQTCTMCSKIPFERDFRGRVMREDHSIEKRGARGTEGGRRFGYLSRDELAAHSRVIRKKLKLESFYHWAARTRILQLKVKRPTLRESAKEASSTHNLLKFCQNILSAHRSGAFGGRPALWDFMRDTAANLNRSKRGFRFSSNTKTFSQAMKMYGGRRMVDLFSLNYAGPSLNSVKRENKKGVQFISGEHKDIFAAVAEIYRDAKRAHGIVGPVPVILAEDETKVKGRVAWEQNSYTLFGFCGPKEGHVCVLHFKPIVGTGEEGYSQILDSFRTNKIGGFARAIVVNPLHHKLPRLVLVVCSTCNCFDSAWVRKQWSVIDNLWALECKETIGPIVGHASDGDSRRRTLMLADFKGSSGLRLKINWKGWLFSASLDAKGDASGLHDQDFIHDGKKLVNPLDSGVRVLQLGSELCGLSHIGMVYNKYTFDQHSLKLEDWKRTDRQNWASAQRICALKARTSLAMLRNSEEVHRERTLGTELYLEVCANYISIFLSPRLDLRSRIVLAAKVSFFFRIWKLWFKYGNHAVCGNTKKPTAAHNFVSQQCFVDVQMNCHFLVLLVCHFRDKYPHMSVPLHLTGSDACEIFFSKVGGMQGMERAYDFHQLISTANTVNRLARAEYAENGLKFGRVHNKVENVWEKLHPLLDGEARCDLGDYTLISSNEDVVAALKEGLKAAQQLINVLNMAPSSRQAWFHTPWIVERADPTHLAYNPGSKPTEVDDGDAEVLRAQMEEGDGKSEVVVEGEVVEETVLHLPIIEDETRQVISNMLDTEEVFGELGTAAVKVIPTVEYGGHQIFKATLVSQLNANPFLSKDRLTRVKNSIYFNNSDDYISASSSSTSMLVGLGSDVGVFFVSTNSTRISSTVKATKKRSRGRPPKNNTPTSIFQRADSGTWWIGRVQMMRRKVGTKWDLCRQPVDLQKRQEAAYKKGATLPTFEFMMYYFSRAPGHLKFHYDQIDCKWVDVDSIMSNVTMEYDPIRKNYSLDPVDAKSLDEFVAISKL